MAAKAHAISISKLSDAAHVAAKAALAKANLPNAQVDAGVLYGHPWIIGIIIRNPDLAHAAQYQAVAEQITAGISKVELNPQPLPPRVTPAIYHYDHVIICGYLPVDELPATLAQ